VEDGLAINERPVFIQAFLIFQPFLAAKGGAISDNPNLPDLVFALLFALKRSSRFVD
jgi:hypothetical protein